jgi:hypothetical protein
MNVAENEARKSNGQFAEGNPGGGAPKGNRSNHWNKLLNESTTDEQFKGVWAKALELALAGEPEMIKFVTERLAGKVPQAMEHTGADGAPITVAWPPPPEVKA